MGMLRRPPQEEDRGHTIKRVSTERLSKATWANITASRCREASGPSLYRALEATGQLLSRRQQLLRGAIRWYRFWG